MSLPAIDTIADSADFSSTVLPALQDLTLLPSKLLAGGFDLKNIQQTYITINPFATAIALSLFLAPVFLIVSEVNRNWSQVDRCWSLLPSLYNAHYALWSRLNGLSTSLVDTILIISLIWSARLTFNYWRKGGYKVGSEDYRWDFVRKFVNNRIIFFMLNITFISLFQSILLMLLTAPTYIFVLYSAHSQRTTASGFEIFDLTFIQALLLFIGLETIADQQQWTFQQAKKEYFQIAKVPQQYKRLFIDDDLNRGFVVSGLFSYCRHPNFACEQAFWITLHQWACLKSRTWFNWAGVGAILYILLFQGSTTLTENLTAKKYPEYCEYQKSVGRFIPSLWLGQVNQLESEQPVLQEPLQGRSSETQDSPRDMSQGR